MLGIGVDLVHIPGFAAQLELPGSRFAAVFTAREHRRAENRAADAGLAGVAGTQHLAAVWALKEAFIKAWSGALLGAPPVIDSSEVTWQEIEVRHDRWGRPHLDLSGAVAAAVRESLGEIRLLCSASHDGDYATATVALERARVAEPPSRGSDDRIDT